MKLPPTLSLAKAAEMLGVSRSFAYSLVARDRFPTPVIRLGQRIIVPTQPLLELLGIVNEADQA